MKTWRRACFELPLSGLGMVIVEEDVALYIIHGFERAADFFSNSIRTPMKQQITMD